MKILNDYTKKTELLAMLIELNMDYRKEENKAFDKRDFEKAKEYIKLRDYIEKIMNNLEK